MPDEHSTDGRKLVGRQPDGVREGPAFQSEPTYARAARLIASTTEPGLVVDLSASIGLFGDAVSPFEMTYLGLDSDPDNVAAMIASGKDAGLVDLTESDAADQILNRIKALGELEVPVVALVALDVIGQFPDSLAVVSMLRVIVDRIAEQQNGAVPLLVVSVANVAHSDTAAGLVLGHWHATGGGPRDTPDLSHFTDRRLSDTMEHSGFSEVNRSDVRLDGAEQRFPSDAVVFGQATLAVYLRSLSGAMGQIERFVRSYRRDQHLKAELESVVDEPFLSVIVRTQGNRDSLVDTLTSLAAQRDGDLETLVMVHHDDADVAQAVGEAVAPYAPSLNAYVHHVTGGGRSAPLNAALKMARGRYVAILDDDDTVTPDWVAAFRRAADRLPGRMVRAACVVQWIKPVSGRLIDFEPVSGFEAMYPTRFDFVDTVRSNRSPPCCYASPMTVVRALDISFDDTLRVCEDWKFELEVARIAGVSDDPAVTSVYRRWRGGGGSAAAEDAQKWIEDHERVIDDLDVAPTVFPAGSLRRIHELYRHIENLEVELGRRGPDDLPYSAL